MQRTADDHEVAVLLHLAAARMRLLARAVGPHTMNSSPRSALRNISSGSIRAGVILGRRCFGPAARLPGLPIAARLSIARSQSQPAPGLAANHDVTVHVGSPKSRREARPLRSLSRLSDRLQGLARASAERRIQLLESFVDNPLPTQNGASRRRRLIGVGYVDPLPDALSAIYFFYDPEERQPLLGTFNVLSILAEAAGGIPYLYLGYFVAGCRSLEYKANFTPTR